MLGIIWLIFANLLDFNNTFIYVYLLFLFFSSLFWLKILELDNKDTKLNLIKRNTIRKKAYVSDKDKKITSYKIP